MKIGRREFVAATGAAIPGALLSYGNIAVGKQMFGLIGKIAAVEGKREELITILLDGVSRMPGCLSYIVAKDPVDANAIWITEVWDSKESHARSLNLPSVKEAIKKGRPMIAGFSDSHTTEPVGGHGLPKK
jgi:quinol monooxygenase YgiN